MASDYKAILEDNVRRRGTDFDDIGKFLAEKLYGDKSHFIYELLQNAEDALARRHQDQPDGNYPDGVIFHLFRDHLEVSHFGLPFDEEDVRGISDVLRGTKTERLDQIGTFGIGFKSVYAFTCSPEIHSGNEHFVIEHFIRPSAVAPRTVAKPDQTLFYFPFDNPEYDAELAYQLIFTKLEALGPRALLFLHHVKEIHWIVDGAKEGIYIREERPDPRGGVYVDIVGQSEGEEVTSEEWLVVRKDVPHHARKELLPIKIAYRIHTTHDNKTVQPLNRSPLIAYFPTAQETGLGFLIHGPFAPTPARDNIESDNPWNIRLIDELAALIATSLSICREHGLLTADFMAVLPLDSERFPEESSFRPLYDVVLEALSTEPLIPVCENGHAPASSILLGRSQEVRELFSGEFVGELLGKPERCRWADAGITDNRLPVVWRYLRDECDIPVVDGEAVVSSITKDFLEERDDNWIIQFYRFLADRQALWRKRSVQFSSRTQSPLHGKPFIRCEDGIHRCPFDSSGRPLVYLPFDGDSSFHVVKKTIYADEGVQDFCAALGLILPDECATILSSVLPKYATEDDCVISDDEHNNDLTKIDAALRLVNSPQYKEMVDALRHTAWLGVSNAETREKGYCCPREAYLRTNDLTVFFRGNPRAWFVEDDLIGVDGLIQLGVQQAPRISCKGLADYQTNPYSSVSLSSSHGWHEKGLECFDPDTNVDGLLYALDHISLERAEYIWNRLLPKLLPFLHGTVVSATRQDFSNAQYKEKNSTLGELVKKKCWIPTDNEEYVVPEECAANHLHPILDRNEDIIKGLGIPPDPEKESIENEIKRRKRYEKAGLPEDVASFLARHEDLTGQELSDAVDTYRKERGKRPEFPMRSSRNPDRREVKVQKRLEGAPRKEYESRNRSVRTSSTPLDPSTWLRDLYTNSDGVMVCQMCKWPMPFRLRSQTEFYFESVQVSDNLEYEDHSFYLALCPLCAAKYKVLFKKGPDDGVRALLQALRNSSDPEIEINLGAELATISFVETHRMDLRAALNRVMP